MKYILKRKREDQALGAQTLPSQPEKTASRGSDTPEPPGPKAFPRLPAGTGPNLLGTALRQERAGRRGRHSSPRNGPGKLGKLCSGVDTYINIQILFLLKLVSGGLRSIEERVARGSGKKSVSGREASRPCAVPPRGAAALWPAAVLGGVS